MVRDGSACKGNKQVAMDRGTDGSVLSVGTRSTDKTASKKVRDPESNTLRYLLAASAGHNSHICVPP